MGTPVRFLSSIAVSAVQDYVGEIIDASDDLSLLSFHLWWRGTPTGTFALYQTNLPNPGRNPAKGWVPVPTAEVDFTGKTPAGSDGSSFVNVSLISGHKYLLVYSHTGGSGTLDGYSVAKGAGEEGPVGPAGPVGPQGAAGPDGVQGPDGDSLSNALIYRETSGEAGPVIYGSFAGLYAKLEALRAKANGGGRYRIIFDASLAGGVEVTIPIGTYDFTNVVFDGGVDGVRVLFADGCSVSGLREFENGIVVRNQNTSAPLEVLPAATLVIRCRNGATLETINGGTQPFYDVATNGSAYVTLELFNGSRIGGSTNGVVFGGTNVGEGFQSGKYLVAKVADQSPTQAPFPGSGKPNVIKGAVGSVLILQADSLQNIGASSGDASSAFPSWLGSVSVQHSAPAGLVPNPSQGAGSEVAVTSAKGEMLRLDLRGGPISQALPALAGASGDLAFPGGLLSVTETGNESGLVLTPAAGDTMAGAKYAKGVLTLAGNPANGETVTVGSKTYTFQTVLTDVDGNVQIGASASVSLDNLIAAIMLGAGAGTLYALSTTANADVRAKAGEGDTMLAQARALGTGGNSLATTETLVTAGSQWGGATLSGGDNGSLEIVAGGGALLQSDGVNHWHLIGHASASHQPGNTWIYKPGSATNGPVIFSDWKELEAAKEACRAASGGEFTGIVRIDNTLVTPAVIPANDGDPAYDFRGITIEGSDSTFTTRLDFADGASITGLRRIGKHVGIRSLSTSPLEVVSVDGFLAAIFLGVGSYVNSAGGSSFWDGSNMSSGEGIQMILADYASINYNFGGGSGTDAVIDLTVSGTYAVIINLGQSSYPLTGVKGVAGTSCYPTISTGRGIPNTILTSFGGTVVVASINIPASLSTTPLYEAPATASIGAGVRPGEWLRLDASGGAIAQPLPGISGFGNNYKQPGVFFAVTETSGSEGLTVTPQAGDTINGVNAALPIPPGGTVLFLGDGISDWFAVGSEEIGYRVVYRPGGSSEGPISYGSWSLLMERIAAIRAIAPGCQIELHFDDSVVSPIAIPVGGPYDMTGVKWTGNNGRGIGDPIRVTIPEGVSFTKLQEFGGNIRVTNLATATVPDQTLASGDNVTVRDEAHIENQGSVALWDSTVSGAGIIFFLIQDRGALAFNGAPTAPIFDMLANTGTIIGGCVDFGSIRNDCFAGSAGGASLILNPIGDTAKANTDQSTFAGSVSQVVQQYTRLDTDQSVQAASNTVDVQMLRRYDTTLADRTATLVTAASAFRGQLVGIKNEIGSNLVNVTPAGADTIEGVAGVHALPAGKSLVLVSDGTSNWTILSEGGNSSSFPEKWGQDNVAASQAGVDLGAKVSTNFNTIKATKAGSIVGISTRLSETLTDATADSLIVKVTINGVPGTLSVSHNSAANATGGETVQPPGVDAFSAGDLIGIEITTLASFTPVTTDLEAWLEYV